MSKPYYDDGRCTIYHGDCVEVLKVGTYDPIDLIVTDPPYGQNYHSGLRNSMESFEKITGDTSTDVALAGLRVALNVLRNNRHIYIFGRFDLTSLPLSEPAELIWDKGQVGGGDLTSPWGKEHEYIQFSTLVKSQANRKDGYGRLAARLRRGSVLRYDRLNSRAAHLHPTEKPVDLLRELIESSSHLDELVLDPFMGSGSTLVAAMREDRRAIGIEIEERYCEIAANRLRQEVFAHNTD
jgi:DNA modification methylase